jgi:hypothetical protein
LILISRRDLRTKVFEMLDAGAKVVVIFDQHKRRKQASHRKNGKTWTLHCDHAVWDGGGEEVPWCVLSDAEAEAYSPGSTVIDT